jgi:hypothetical protein
MSNAQFNHPSVYWKKGQRSAYVPQILRRTPEGFFPYTAFFPPEFSITISSVKTGKIGGTVENYQLFVFVIENYH